MYSLHVLEGRGRGTRLKGQGGDGGPRTFAGVDGAEAIEGSFGY